MADGLEVRVHNLEEEIKALRQWRHDSGGFAQRVVALEDTVRRTEGKLDQYHGEIHRVITTHLIEAAKGEQRIESLAKSAHKRIDEMAGQVKDGRAAILAWIGIGLGGLGMFWEIVRVILQRTPFIGP